MTSDAFLNIGDKSYAELKREYNTRGFSGISHEMNVVRYCQAWRLFQGAEPSSMLSGVVPATHMRYGPYQTTP